MMLKVSQAVTKCLNLNLELGNHIDHPTLTHGLKTLIPDAKIA